MSKYDVNFALIAERVLPPDKRGPVLLAWFWSWLYPLQQLSADFFGTFAPLIIDFTRRNAQKIVLEKILNDAFPNISEGLIYINNQGDDISPIFFHNTSEGYKGITFYNSSEIPDSPRYFRNVSEISSGNIFTVYVPAYVLSTYGEDDISLEIEKYRVYGTTFIIVSY